MVLNGTATTLPVKFSTDFVAVVIGRPQELLLQFPAKHTDPIDIKINE